MARRLCPTTWHVLVVLAALTAATGAVAAHEDVGLRLTSYAEGASSDTNIFLLAATGGLVGALALLGIAGAVIWRMALRLRAARRAIDHELVRYEQLAEQTSDVVLRIRNKRATISTSIEHLTGYTAVEMHERGMAALVHPDDLPGVVAAYDDVGAEGAGNTITYRLIHKNGTTVWVEAMFGCLVSDDGDCETIVTIRDITKRHVEAETLQAAMHAARGAREAADEANRAKGDFLASMSHEIRTPLNAIIGFADLQLAMKDLPPTAQLHAERIRAGGDALLMIVNDILDFAQAESGKLRLDPRPFALPLLVDECIALVENAAVAKSLALKVDLVDRFPMGLMGDEARLRQILLNLLNNAIKFTARGSVTLRIGYDRRAGGDRIDFEVADTGIGIAAAQLPNLFQRFHQVDGTIRRSYGGTGLGLAISKMLAELMGGTIRAVSTKDVGSTFTFSVDLPTASLVLAPGTSRDTASRPLSILLVEDMPINQELAQAVLEAKGHKVDVVGDGAEAIMAVDTFVYDLVLMDIQMPFVDGLTATRAIRALPNERRFVPIVAMTANVLKTQIDAAIEAGMDDVLAKPLSIDAMQAILAKVERGTLRADLSDALDRGTFAKLVDVIGDARTHTMLQTLARTLSERFTRDLADDTTPFLKAEAHASMAAAATLGFAAFASLCRVFIAASEPSRIEESYRALRRELERVVLLSHHLASAPSLGERRAA